MAGQSSVNGDDDRQAIQYFDEVNGFESWE
jgi:hypothetical protein